MNCLQGFNQESVRDDHYVYCANNESVRVDMPMKAKSILKFGDG